jgi:hypothetical protein
VRIGTPVHGDPVSSHTIKLAHPAYSATPFRRRPPCPIQCAPRRLFPTGCGDKISVLEPQRHNKPFTWLGAIDPDPSRRTTVDLGLHFFGIALKLECGRIALEDNG